MHLAIQFIQNLIVGHDLQRTVAIIYQLLNEISKLDKWFLFFPIQRINLKASLYENLYQALSGHRKYVVSWDKNIAHNGFKEQLGIQANENDEPG